MRKKITYNIQDLVHYSNWYLFTPVCLHRCIKFRSKSGTDLFPFNWVAHSDYG
jgi:hypothetical protein